MKNKLTIRLAAVLLCMAMLFSVACTTQNTTTTPTTDTTTGGEPTTPESNETTAPEAVETTTPEAVETTTPEDVETTTPEDVETTTPEDVETTTPENVETTTPEDVETTTPEDVETTTPEDVETTTPEVDEPDYPENGVEKIVSKSIKLYSAPEMSTDLLFAHYEKYPDILLIDLETAFVELLFGMQAEKAEYSVEETETTIKVTRDNGAYCILDFVEDTIFYNDFDLFNTRFSNSSADMLASEYIGSEGNEIYFSRTDSTNIAGLSVHIDLANRGIPLDIYEGQKYIPFQTFCDLFIAPCNNVSFVYNNKDLFVAGGGNIHPDLMDDCYSIEPTQRSEALANYSYSELCLLLDLYYGLQDEHGVIVGFDIYLEYAGLRDDLLSTDPSVASIAIGSLMFGYLADLHSALNLPSPYTGSSAIDKSQIKVDPSILSYYEYSTAISTARNEAMPEGVLGYEEVGNTAYVTFDSFTIDAIRFQDYTDASTITPDTIGLIIYAHSQITREGSPIENVVLDLSCNGGGAFDAAVYVVAWMLGYCNLHITNPVTNSFSTISYKVDVNLDGVFDEKDTISHLNLYCLISPASFSCGNLVPALLKESNNVTLIGNTSGGGACSVMHSTTADGTCFQFSSPSRLAVVTNGSYYTIDRGIDPHIYLTKLASYFDREALTTFINELK